MDMENGSNTGAADVARQVSPLPPPAPMGAQPEVAAKGKGSLWLIPLALAVGLGGGFLVGRATRHEKSVAAPSAPAVTQATTIAPAPAAATQLDEALALHTAGKLDEAAKAYGVVLASDPKNKFALYNLGLIAQGRQQYDEAIKRYEASIATDPAYMPALYNLGLTQVAKGNLVGAIASLRRAVAVEPKFAPAKFNLGKALVANGQADEGSQLVAEAIALDPTLKPKA
jgi:tetratricopeptide (TPR) repeat protein